MTFGYLGKYPLPPKPLFGCVVNGESVDTQDVPSQDVPRQKKRNHVEVSPRLRSRFCSVVGFLFMPPTHPIETDLVGRERDAFDEPLGHADERRFGPWEEPVNGGAVDEGWEITAPDAKRVAHGGHAEDDVEILANAGDEGREAGVPGLRNAEFLAHRDHVGRHFVLFMLVFVRKIVSCWRTDRWLVCSRSGCFCF